MTVEFEVLGDLVARVDGQVVALGPARRQCVLAALLVDANRSVTLDQLVERVWGGEPPFGAAGTLRSYLSRLRQVLGADVIERGALGYRLVVAPEQVDLHRYRTAVAAGQHEKAFALWRGEPFAGLHTAWLDDARRALVDEHFAARLDHHDHQLDLGGHTAVLPGIAELSQDHPFNERLHGQYLLALARGGRQAEALDHYETVRRRLADALGADPGPELRGLHQDILAGAVTGAPRQTTPRQLPPDIRGFVGREAALASLSALLGDLDVTGAGPIVISAIDGAGGIGKTTLAVHWAHRVKHLFPDGQLYLNLRGYGPGSPLSPHDALESLLRALGVATDRIPHDLAERAALLRSQLDGQRVLVLLDNAKDAEQVRPLLPGSDSLVLITSRGQLRSLSVREGAALLALDLLSPPEALILLGSVLGAGRVGREREAALELVELCARLPLAVRLAAEQAVLRPEWSLRRLVGELRARPSRLAALSLDDDVSTDLRAVFDWSYRALSPEAARVFRLLGVFPGTDIAAEAVAALAGVPPASAPSVLRQLVSASMLEQRGGDRYELHDLLREFARELDREPAEEQAAETRLVDWYVRTAEQAHAHLTGVPHRLPMGPPVEGVTPLEFADRRAAVEWCDTERDTLLALVLGGHGGRRPAIVLAQLCWQYFHLRGSYQHLMDAYEAALAYAVELGDEYLEARCCNGLQIAYSVFRGADDDLALGLRALRIFEKLGDTRQQATSLLNLSSTYNHAGRYGEAAETADRSRQLSFAQQDLITAAMALNNHADALTGLGRYAEALVAAERAADEFRALGELSRLVAGLETIALVHVASGDHASAVAAYRDAVEATEATQATARAVVLRVALGHQLVAAGEPDSAVEAWRRAHELALQRQDPAAAEIEELLRVPRPDGLRIAR
ncbi:BTAD domain-containing putative transcriptional regulator [Amycolatopsis sp. 195334CR]|uniref:AfsR/SARP family transcriptional regulator n=1 Tax=Amycolatopsis sp. 195334CR TaxID=2814588 RepID=UPI001A8EA194|nr:BTAD domain-containing putative transcriptional regulator [Amycolatopsis sp. 195334CR]MBN6033672.1 winged helix-turn-helix domain-containing protein [Amycolatopsis sp. 195334CR]